MFLLRRRRGIVIANSLSLAIVLFLFSTFSAYASDDSSADWASADLMSSQDILKNSNWEFGIQSGIAIPIGNKSTRILANNSAFLVSDPADPGEDEFEENGLPSPDFTAQTLIQGDMQSSFYIGGHLYYRLTSWIATGIEGGVTIQRDTVIHEGGSFQVPIYKTEFASHGGQITPAIRLGGWMGNIRPYIMAGAGPYFLYQRVTAELLDADDPDHPPVIAGETNNTYLSSLWGGGVDFNFFDEGSVGLAVQYLRVYQPGNDIQYFIPTMRFDYHF